MATRLNPGAAAMTSLFGCDPEILDKLPSAEEMVRNLDRAGYPSSISNRVEHFDQLDVSVRRVAIHVRRGDTYCALGYGFKPDDTPQFIERVSRAMMMHILATQFPGASAVEAPEEV